MKQAHVAGIKPIKEELEEGKKYAWCACGLSATQPFCDGSHRGTDFTPVVFSAEKSEAAFLCACKRTANPPYWPPWSRTSSPNRGSTFSR